MKGPICAILVTILLFSACRVKISYSQFVTVVPEPKLSDLEVDLEVTTSFPEIRADQDEYSAHNAFVTSWRNDVDRFINIACHNGQGSPSLSATMFQLIYQLINQWIEEPVDLGRAAREDLLTGFSLIAWYGHHFDERELQALAQAFRLKVPLKGIKVIVIRKQHWPAASLGPNWEMIDKTLEPCTYSPSSNRIREVTHGSNF